MSAFQDGGLQGEDWEEDVLALLHGERVLKNQQKKDIGSFVYFHSSSSSFFLSLSLSSSATEPNVIDSVANVSSVGAFFFFGAWERQVSDKKNIEEEKVEMKGTYLRCLNVPLLHEFTQDILKHVVLVFTGRLALHQVRSCNREDLAIIRKRVVSKLTDLRSR
jgi:hypothetical protein